MPEPPIRTVLADDMAEIREILVLLLRGGGFEVVAEAADGGEAVEAAERLQPDLVILDVDMPRVDGWEALTRVRSVAPNAAVAMLSGDSSVRLPDGLAQPPDLVLTKGLPALELLGSLRRTVGRSPVETPDVRRRTPAGGVGRLPADRWQAQLAAIVESSEDAIVGKELDGTILSWNRGAERLYGWTAEEAVGRHITFIVPPEQGDEIAANLARIAGGDPVERYDTERITKDGRRIVVSLVVSPVLGQDGTVVGASAIGRDVTEQRRSEQALSRAVRRLEEQNQELLRSNQELDAFASVASHDLAQPLQVAHGYLELVRSEYGDQLDPIAAGWLDTAFANLERTRTIVRDVLRYARLGSSGGAATSVPLDDVVDEALAALEAAIVEAGAAVDVDRPLPTVRGDRVQLTSLFQNLIGNAVKFGSGGGDARVTVRGEVHDGRATVTVDDRGPGVEPERRQLVFDMFEKGRGDPAAGTGVGLAICRKVVDRHGGDLWVTDRPDGPGARFVVVLPTP